MYNIKKCDILPRSTLLYKKRSSFVYQVENSRPEITYNVCFLAMKETSGTHWLWTANESTCFSYFSSHSRAPKSIKGSLLKVFSKNEVDVFINKKYCWIWKMQQDDIYF